MNKKVQLNDMELNQVAGGGLKEFWQKLKDIFTSKPTLPIRPKEPDHMIPMDPSIR